MIPFTCYFHVNIIRYFKNLPSLLWSPLPVQCCSAVSIISKERRLSCLTVIVVWNSIFRLNGCTQDRTIALSIEFLQRQQQSGKFQDRSFLDEALQCVNPLVACKKTNWWIDGLTKTLSNKVSEEYLVLDFFFNQFM